MKSKKSSKLLDLQHDVPTSEADVRALRNARAADRLNLESYLVFLATVPAAQVAFGHVRKHPVKVFEL